MGSQPKNQEARASIQILADLRPPHIAALLDGGTTPQSTAYLVMEYIEGRNIDDHCLSSNLEPEAILKLFIQIFGALAFAHGKNILHRDIKPSNIMVNQYGSAMLMDFGIAAREETQSPPITQEGFGPMTPQYAAPEQWRGEPASVASDIYSLGLVLLQLLARKRPRQMGAYRLEDLCATY